MAKKTLCTNPYCLREHIKWGDLIYFPIEYKNAQGAWDSYDWKLIKKNSEVTKRKKMKDKDTKVDMETTGTKTHGTIKGRETMIITEDTLTLIQEEI